MWYVAKTHKREDKMQLYIINEVDLNSDLENGQE